MNYNLYMEQAYKEAIFARSYNEVPIGCVIVYENKIIARGFNKRNNMKNVLYHAEMEAINKACVFLGDWRLENCTMFVTVEPCIMCAGAILQARIKKLVYGAKNKKGGSAGSVIDVLKDNKFNHKVEVISGVMEKECEKILTNFFENLRRS